jgi:hypothetical protein
VVTVTPTTYLLPIRVTEPAPDELTRYLRRMATWCPVIVVDGSPDPVFAAHARRWGAFATHLPAESRTTNGKVAGVVDGVAAASTPLLVIADDDVRYDKATLARLVELLADHTAVMPQNYFSPLPWHARWDSARSLLNRAFGHDYAGTVGVHREALLRSRGYCGNVLFENLEMLRTLVAGGGTVHYAKDLYVVRRPPNARHFLGQRVRQAFDSQAQPARQALELAGLPLLTLALTRGPAALAGAAAVSVAVAEAGRRTAGGRAVFPWHVSWWAPCWVLERAVCAWLAVASKRSGGIRYAGRRVPTAAHSVDTLRAGGCPEGHCRCDTVLRAPATGAVNV